MQDQSPLTYGRTRVTQMTASNDRNWYSQRNLYPLLRKIKQRSLVVYKRSHRQIN